MPNLGSAHAQQLVGRGSWVTERAKQIEYCRYTQLPAHRRHVFHRRMQHGREAETDTDFVETLLNDLDRGFDIDTQHGQHIGGTRLAADFSIAMFGDRNSASGRYKRGGSTDVKCS